MHIHGVESLALPGAHRIASRIAFSHIPAPICRGWGMGIGRGNDSTCLGLGTTSPSL